MKKNLPLILIGLILTAGIGIFLYPTASDILSRITSTTVIKEYQGQVEKTDEKEMEQMLAAAEEYNEKLPDKLTMDPFGTDSDDPSGKDAEYNSLLSINGVMGYVDIPKIDVYLPVYHGTSEEVLQKGAGHLYGSALPVGGEGRHSVVSAHRGLPSAKLFTDLDQLEVGDVFYFHVLNRILAYQIDQINVVEPDELEALDPQDGNDFMTLFTCTPYGINSHRMLLRGVRIPYEPAHISDMPMIAAAPPKENAALPKWAVFYMAAGAAAAAGVIIAALTIRKKNKRKKKKEKREE